MVASHHPLLLHAPPRHAFPKRKDTDKGRGKRRLAATYSSPSLVVMQVHHDAGALVGASLVNSLTLPGINELLGEAVSIFDVIPASAPKPVPGQVLGPCSSAAATRGELTLAAGTAHGVDHPSCAYRVGERGLSAPCAETEVMSGECLHTPLPACRLSQEGNGSAEATKIHLPTKGRATLNHAPQNVFTVK